MWKNREVKWLIFLAAVLTVGLVFVWRYYPSALAGAAVASVAVLTAFFAASMLFRSRKIKKLSEYLYDLAEGKNYIAIKDYNEGELSCLKSEIYKLAVKLTEQAELLNRDKVYLADAISDISHQLKTPVTSMRVMADLLSDGGLPDEKRLVFAANIDSQLNRMEWLVTALLKMAKLDAEAVTLKNESFTPEELIKKASEHLLIPMELKNISFEAEGDLRAYINGDVAWLSEALANILKNCMEHTPAGGKIKVTAEKTALYTAVKISDTGSGIDPEDLPHIFERFYKGKNASADSVGIGLAMAKQIIYRSNGVLTVEKTGKDGTTFCMKLYKR